jgi:hypothetical protein
VSKAIYSAILAVGGNPTDPVWEWLAVRGPHGPSFTWGQTKTEPAGYVGVEHLERIVKEQQSINSGFRAQAQRVVQLALKSSDIGLLLRGVQVAAVVGGEEELDVIQGLSTHQDPAVAANARASAFYLKRRLKSVRRDAKQKAVGAQRSNRLMSTEEFGAPGRI